MRQLFAFPNPVNEKAARTVAGVVLAIVILILATSWYWLLIPLVYGFWARVLTGPTLSPLGWTAQRLIAPRLGAAKPVSGPPKRFAQLMGAVMSSAALVLALIAGDHTAADVVLILFVAAVQVISGALLLVNRFVPLALALLAPVLYNILVFHITMQPSGLPPGLFASILWLILVWRLRDYFAPLFVQKAVEK